MWLLILEAALALALLLFAVWWVMFSGRDKGEPRAPVETPDEPLRPGEEPRR